MSGPDHRVLIEPRARDIQARAAEWVAEQRYAENWTAENQAALDAWLAEDAAHEVAYWRLDAAWERTSRLAALRGPMRNPVSPGRSAVRSRWYRLVAAVAIVAALGWTVTTYRSPAPEETFATPIGGQKTLSLSDGSQITLNTNTALRIRLRGGLREVWLDHGEAFFDVRHDAAHPFVVVAAGHKITDLGTKFSVRTTDGIGLRVTLTEGRAELNSASSWVSSHRVVLTPGDVAVASAHELSVSRPPPKELAEELAWRRGMLVFQHTTLKDAVAEFNRYNDQTLAIVDPDVGQIRIAGTFQATNPELFTEAVQELFKLRVSKSGSRIIISH